MRSVAHHNDRAGAARSGGVRGGGSGRRLKVVRRKSEPMLNSERMAHLPKTRALEPMPELPPGYDPARAEHIRELWDAVHASDDPKEQERLWAELGQYILGAVRVSAHNSIRSFASGRLATPAPARPRLSCWSWASAGRLSPAGAAVLCCHF
jgi:hypothetical protein